MANESLNGKWEKKRLFLLELYKPKTAFNAGTEGETLLNMFPNPCSNETYFYTDDPEAAWIVIQNAQKLAIRKLPIAVGKTLHFFINCAPGDYYVQLLNKEMTPLGAGKILHVIK